MRAVEAEGLVHGLRDATLPRAQWTHAARFVAGVRKFYFSDAHFFVGIPLRGAPCPAEEFGSSTDSRPLP